MEVNAFPFIGYELGMRGSLVGGRQAVRLMLEFAARHGIKPQVEVYPFVSSTHTLLRYCTNGFLFQQTVKGLEDAMESCETYKARYRAVIVKGRPGKL
jgi:D-arabinose 1-dehydrogenase-like Zn-dependent alcohol dehydrogenase